jgi:hypothetical protein
VKVGARTSTTAEIVEGLKAGERVVTSGAYGVEDSTKVVAPKDTTAAPADDEKNAGDEKKPDDEKKAEAMKKAKP